MVKIIATILAVAGAGGLLLYSSISEAEYYKYTHEVVDEPTEWEGKTLRVHGYVEPGSIDERIVDQKTVRDFVLASNGRRLRVINEGPKPDTFRDESEVVAKGTLKRDADGELYFEATELMAKCPSKYEENKRTNGSSTEPMSATVPGSAGAMTAPVAPVTTPATPPATTPATTPAAETVTAPQPAN